MRQENVVRIKKDKMAAIAVFDHLIARYGRAIMVVKISKKYDVTVGEPLKLLMFRLMMGPADHNDDLICF